MFGKRVDFLKLERNSGVMGNSNVRRPQLSKIKIYKKFIYSKFFSQSDLFAVFWVYTANIILLMIENFDEMEIVELAKSLVSSFNVKFNHRLSQYNHMVIFSRKIRNHEKKYILSVSYYLWILNDTPYNCCLVNLLRG